MTSYQNSASKILILSSSLRPDSRSRRLGELAHSILRNQDCNVLHIDLKTLNLPEFDDDKVYNDESFQNIHALIKNSDSIILCVPVYNWSLGSLIKNVIESTGSTEVKRGMKSAWFDKVITFLVAGGLPHSYTAHLGLANSLMLDFKCVINPYHTYATSRDWQGDTLSQPIEARLSKTLDVHLQLCRLLTHRTYTSNWEI